MLTYMGLVHSRGVLLQPILPAEVFGHAATAKTALRPAHAMYRFLTS